MGTFVGYTFNFPRFPSFMSPNRDFPFRETFHLKQWWPRENQPRTNRAFDVWCSPLSQTSIRHRVTFIPFSYDSIRLPRTRMGPRVCAKSMPVWGLSTEMDFKLQRYLIRSEFTVQFTTNLNCPHIKGKLV